jgi:hypothetical protein
MRLLALAAVLLAGLLMAGCRQPRVEASGFLSDNGNLPLPLESLVPDPLLVPPEPLPPAEWASASPAWALAGWLDEYRPTFRPPSTYGRPAR